MKPPESFFLPFILTITLAVNTPTVIFSVYAECDYSHNSTSADVHAHLMQKQKIVNQTTLCGCEKQIKNLFFPQCNQDRVEEFKLKHEIGQETICNLKR